MPETAEHSSMHAIVVRHAGAPEVMQIETVPRPTPEMTKVLVRVTAAGVNPADWKNRQRGNLLHPPFTPGWDIAGVVEKLGFGVTRFKVGQRVFGMPAFPYEAGGYAEYATARSRQLAATPETLTDVEAAALPLAGLTAYQTLIDTAGVTDGTRVLILAAAGGVGHLAVQIAKAYGAYVIGTASSQNHELLKELGADEAVDYTRGSVSEAVHDVDVVLDLVGGPAGLDALPSLRDGGLYINVPSAHDAETIRHAARDRVRVTNFLVEPDRTGMDALAALVASGKLRPRVSQTFPLSDAAEAHRLGEKGQTGGGKLVLITNHQGDR